MAQDQLLKSSVIYVFSLGLEESDVYALFVLIITSLLKSPNQLKLLKT